jgi:hypothetical protein
MVETLETLRANPLKTGHLSQQFWFRICHLKNSSRCKEFPAETVLREEKAI